MDLEVLNFPTVESLIKLASEAGLDWAENSYGLHRAMIPTDNHRLIVAVNYSLFPLPFELKDSTYSSKDD